jgi:hypothetical protein
MNMGNLHTFISNHLVTAAIGDQRSVSWTI